MKTLWTKLTLTAAAFVLASPVMAAGPYTFYDQGQSYFEQRSETQYRRIRRGEEDGSLTPEESDRLWSDQQRLQEMEREFRADGRLTSDERTTLDTAYNDAGYWIYRLKHNRYFDSYWGGRDDDIRRAPDWSGYDRPDPTWHGRYPDSARWRGYGRGAYYQDRDASPWHH